MAPEPQFCTDIAPECLKYTIYGYRPNLGVNAFFVAFFAVCFAANIWLGIRYRIKGYAIALALGCLAMVLGYLGRLGLYFRPFDAIPFQAQVCCLIISPAFNSAAVYLMLKYLVELFGPECSILKPKQYTIVFVTADIISLVLQATGGGIAATAGSDKDMLELGNNIMMAGIAFQVVTLSIFAILSVLFLVRRIAARPVDPLSGTALEAWRSMRFRLFLFGLITAFTAIYIRCIYRIAEMRGGWGNHLMKDEIAFIILEGFMMLIATLTQTALHPGLLFPALLGPQMKSSTKG